ncbi:unnamed protein product, partial [Ceratitis capitata]
MANGKEERKKFSHTKIAKKEVNVGQPTLSSKPEFGDHTRDYAIKRDLRCAHLDFSLFGGDFLQ